METLKCIEVFQEDNERRLRIGLNNNWNAEISIKIGDDVDSLFHMLHRLIKELEYGCRKQKE